MSNKTKGIIISLVLIGGSLVCVSFYKDNIMSGFLWGVGLFIFCYSLVEIKD